jgi:hypothetical protein
MSGVFDHGNLTRWAATSVIAIMGDVEPFAEAIVYAIYFWMTGDKISME